MIFFKNKENFKKFLNNIDLTYVKPIGKKFPYEKIYSINEYFKKVEPQYFMTHGFCWRRSPQGDKFWREINYKWREYLGVNPNTWT